MAEKSLNIKSRFEDNRSNTSVKIDESGIQVPVEIQSRYSKTVQNLSDVVIAPATSVNGAYIDVTGFDKIGLTRKNDGTASSSIFLYWSNDGVNTHGYEPLIQAISNQYQQLETPVKARYVKVSLYNADTVPHTMSAWLYLKS